MKIKGFPIFVFAIKTRNRSTPSKAEYVSKEGIFYKQINGRWFSLRRLALIAKQYQDCEKWLNG